MVVTKCAVKGCASSSLKKSIALFDVPESNKALFEKWQEKIETNDGNPLSATSKVCELHFAERCIRKEIISHRNYKSGIRSKLSKTAVPSLLLGPTEKGVNSGVANKSTPVKVSETEISSTNQDEEASTTVTDNSSLQDEMLEPDSSELILEVENQTGSETIITESESFADQVLTANESEIAVEAAEETLANEEVAMETVQEDDVSVSLNAVLTSQQGDVENATTTEATSTAEEVVEAVEEPDASVEVETAAEEAVNDSIAVETTAEEAVDEAMEVETTVKEAVNASVEVESTVEETEIVSEDAEIASGDAENATVKDDIAVEEGENLAIETENTAVEVVNGAAEAENVSEEIDAVVETAETLPVEYQQEESENSKSAVTASDTMDTSDRPTINIQDAAIEAGRLDVLVCGNCHTVFHFIEEFQSHKNAAACNELSSLKSNITEPKPQVWAFLIWKNSQIEDGSSWKLYQRWCQMSESERSVWVAAGARLQECAALSRLKNVPKETPEKIILNKNIRKSPLKGQLQTVRTFVTLTDKKGGEDSEEAAVSQKLNFDSEGEVNSSGMEDGQTDMNSGENINLVSNTIYIKEEVASDVEEQPKHTIKPKSSRTPKPAGSGTEGGDEEESEGEYTVERIISRRYNMKKRQYEYLLKWEGYPAEQNTWEPAENLDACQHLLKAYEANLAKAQQLHKPIPKTVVASAILQNDADGRRPQRNSKQRALNQVKQWCGSMKNDDSGKRRASESTDEEGPSSHKRIKLEKDADFNINKFVNRSNNLKINGVPEKKRTLSHLTAELGIDSDEDLSPAKAFLNSNVRPVVRSISSLSQQNQEVLVASAKGVVKVDPSQVPNLSSGVYIMSNKSGIIKLDSLSPQKALKSLRKTGMLPQTSKGGVVVLQSPLQKGMPRSGIVPKSQVPHKVQAALPMTKVPAQKSILPKSIVHNSVRPAGVLRPSGTSTPRPLRPVVPRMPQLSTRPPPLSKIQFPTLKPKGAQPIVRSTLTPAKDKNKPLHSILGSALLASEDKVKAKTGTTPVVSKNAASKSKISKTQPPQGAKLVENDKILMEFMHQSDSDSDYGIEDNFPADLPPIDTLPPSPPRPLTLDPMTGERLAKAEGERTPSPEPTPPATPPPSKSPDLPEPAHSSESTDTTETLDMTEQSSNQTSYIKVEMSPGGTTGMVTEASSSQEALEFVSLGDDCDVSGLRVKKILSPSSELEQQALQQQEEVAMEGVETEVSQEVEDSIIHVTGEDGTVYQVSSSQLNGDTLVLSEGGDENGQHCVFVTEDGVPIDPAYANQISGEQMELIAHDNTLTVEGEGDEQAQVVAQLVEAGEPIGGGLRRVVLMLPDGNLMMTEVDEEQFAALELDK